MTVEHDPRVSILSVHVARVLFTIEVFFAGLASGLIGVSIALWDRVGVPALVSAIVLLLLAGGAEWVRRRIPR